MYIWDLSKNPEGHLLRIRWELKGNKHRVTNVISLFKIITTMHLPPPNSKATVLSLSGSPKTLILKTDNPL